MVLKSRRRVTQLSTRCCARGWLCAVPTSRRTISTRGTSGTTSSRPPLPPLVHSGVRRPPGNPPCNGRKLCDPTVVRRSARAALSHSRPTAPPGRRATTSSRTAPSPGSTSALPLTKSAGWLPRMESSSSRPMSPLPSTRWSRSTAPSRTPTPRPGWHPCWPSLPCLAPYLAPTAPWLRAGRSKQPVERVTHVQPHRLPYPQQRRRRAPTRLPAPCLVPARAAWAGAASLRRDCGSVEAPEMVLREMVFLVTRLTMAPTTASPPRL